MATIPLLGPAPISVGGGTFNPELDTCFTCTPPYEHPRVWIPDAPRPRTLVLCFDGTGDSFDQDVSPTPEFLSRLFSRLNVAFTEFQCCAIPGDVEEGRSYEAACLLPGDLPRSMRKVRRPHVVFLRLA